jgi:hypothetical protein
MRIFVASSSLAIPQARKFIEACGGKGIKFVPWWDHFKPGHTTYEQLLSVVKKVDRAVVLLTPEHKTKTGKTSQMLPNVNVLLEFGLFLGRLGKRGVVVIKFGKVFIPSDIHGLNYIDGGKFRRSGKEVGDVAKAKFKRWIGRLKKKTPAGARRREPAVLSSEGVRNRVQEVGALLTPGDFEEAEREAARQEAERQQAIALHAAANREIERQKRESTQLDAARGAAANRALSLHDATRIRRNGEPLTAIERALAKEPTAVERAMASFSPSAAERAAAKMLEPMGAQSAIEKALKEAEEAEQRFKKFI